MERRQRAWVPLVTLLSALVIVVGLVWANLSFTSRDQAVRSFTTAWVATRYLLTSGANPYLPESTSEFQDLIYQRPARAGENPLYFLSPLYSLPFYLPFAMTDNANAARVAWMTILELALIALTGLSLSLSGWHIPRWILLLVVLFSITWYYGILAVVDGNLSIPTILFICLAFVTLRARQDALTGFFLALAAVKPTIVILLAIFLLIYAVSEQRWQIFWGFLGSLGIMIAAASLFVPDWLPEYIRQLIRAINIPQATTPASLVALYFPGVSRQFGWLLSAGLGLMLLLEWRAALRKDLRWIYWTACLTLAATPLTGIPTSLENYVALFPGFVLVLTVWDERWRVLGRLLLLVSLLFFSAGIWWLHARGLAAGIPAAENMWLFFSLPVFMIVGMYWARWWAIRPPRLPLEGATNRLVE